MARRKRDNRQPTVELDLLRDLTKPIASPLGLHPTPLRREVLTLEDRRRYNPNRQHAPAAAARSGDRRLTPVPPPGALSRINFAKPNNVAICVRRKIRKEVIHAKRIAGKRGLAGGKWNWHSKVGCK